MIEHENSMAGEAVTPSFLIIHVTRIGDTVMGSAAIRAVARAFPQSEITCLGHPNRFTILKAPYVSHLSSITKTWALWLGRFSGQRYDYALVYGFDLALVRYALRVAKRVVAFRQTDERLNRRLYRLVEPPVVNSMAGVKQFLLLPAALGIKADGFYLSYHVEETERRWASAKLKGLLPAERFLLVGLQIQSFPTKPYRDWPVEYFIALCKKILSHYENAQFLLLGGSLDQDKVTSIVAALGARVHLLAGTLSLRESAAVMQQLDLYIGVDTGPTHIAGALRIPMIALYHCLHPSSGLRPLENPLAQVIDLPVAEEECSSANSMGLISVDMVWDRVGAALSK